MEYIVLNKSIAFRTVLIRGVASWYKWEDPEVTSSKTQESYNYLKSSDL